MLHFFRSPARQSYNHALYHEYRWSRFMTVLFTTFHIYDVCIMTLMDLFTTHFRHDRSCRTPGQSAWFPMWRGVECLFQSTLNVGCGRRSIPTNVFLTTKMVTSRWICILQHIPGRVRHSQSYSVSDLSAFSDLTLSSVSSGYFLFCVCVWCVRACVRAREHCGNGTRISPSPSISVPIISLPMFRNHSSGLVQQATEPTQSHPYLTSRTRLDSFRN
jgi:hypothetical protein